MRQEVNIRKLIREYDYHAALELAAELKDHEKPYMKLIRVAEERELLDMDAVEKKLETNHLKGLYRLPIRKGEKREIFEYALVMQIRLRRGEYADFIRSISPILYRLYKRIMKKKLGICLEEYVSGTKTKAVWDLEKLSGDMVGKGILKILEGAYKSGDGFRCGNVYPVHMQKIIQAKSDDKELKKLVGELREAEEKVRNQAAHQIVSVNKKTIREWMEKEGCKDRDAEWIMDGIKKAIGYAEIIDIANKEVWNSYDQMNEVIIRLMDE